jgi:hypothetical protein
MRATGLGRLRSVMGADGGVITTRQDMVHGRSQSRANSDIERERRSAVANAIWGECALTGTPLKSPVVVSRAGQFFNKQDLFEAIAAKTLPKRFRSLAKSSQRKELDLLGTHSLLEYHCPLSNKSPSPGSSDTWVVLFNCGHFFHGPSFRELGIEDCPVCGAKFTPEDVLSITSATGLSS